MRVQWTLGLAIAIATSLGSSAAQAQSDEIHSVSEAVEIDLASLGGSVEGCDAGCATTGCDADLLW